MIPKKLSEREDMEGNMTVKGLIFDLDGVIVFTDQYHYKAWKQMADEKGIYFDQEINNRLRGVSPVSYTHLTLPTT